MGNEAGNVCSGQMFVLRWRESPLSAARSPARCHRMLLDRPLPTLPLDLVRRNDEGAKPAVQHQRPAWNPQPVSWFSGAACLSRSVASISCSACNQSLSSAPGAKPRC